MPGSTFRRKRGWLTPENPGCGSGKPGRAGIRGRTVVLRSEKHRLAADGRSCLYVCTSVSHHERRCRVDFQPFGSSQQHPRPWFTAFTSIFWTMRANLDSRQIDPLPVEYSGQLPVLCIDRRQRKQSAAHSRLIGNEHEQESGFLQGEQTIRHTRKKFDACGVGQVSPVHNQRSVPIYKYCFLHCIPANALTGPMPSGDGVRPARKCCLQDWRRVHRQSPRQFRLFRPPLLPRGWRGVPLPPVWPPRSKPKRKRP